MLPILIAAVFAFHPTQTKVATVKANFVIAEQTDTVVVEKEAVDKSFWLKESEKKQERWYSYYGTSIKGFACDDFVLLDTFHDVDFTELDVAAYDPALEKYRFESPSSGKLLDIYSYGAKLISDKNGKPELSAANLDSEVAIYGKTAGKKLRLLFCGSSCGFEDAAWIDDDRLLVVGTSNEVGGKNHPMVWGIRLSTRSVYRFMHPAEVPAPTKSFFNTVIATL